MSFVRDKARYNGSGWSFGRLLSCSIHSRMYGEQCRIETPADSHALRKRTASISTRSTSPRSSATRGPALSTSDFTWPMCSHRSCPLKQMRVLRLPALRLIFSVMALCSEEQSNKCNNQAICNLLGEKRFGGVSDGEVSPFGEISPRRNRIKKRKGGAEGGQLGLFKHMAFDSQFLDL